MILSTAFSKKFGYEPRFDMGLFLLLKFGKVSAWNNLRAKNNYNEVYLQACTVDISNVNLKGINLYNTHFEGVTFYNVNLEGADLSNAHFDGAEFINIFSDYKTKITNTCFEGSNFEKFIKEFHRLPFCSYDQYKLLMYCSNKEDPSEWNERRKKHPEERIFLQKLTLNNGNLNGINLCFAFLQGADFDYSSIEKANLNGAHLEGASLKYAHLEESCLYGSHLNNATLEGLFLNNARLDNAIFKGANLDSAHLEGANASGAKFIGANLHTANLRKVNLWEADLENAIFHFSILEGVQISGGKSPNLKKTDFTGAFINGKTVILNCDIDENTNFSAVNLDSARVEPKLLTTLKTNIRRISWGHYYDEKGKFLTLPIRFFWWLSDYGSSSVRIGLSIIIATLFFTDVYLALVKITPNIFTLPDTTSTLLIFTPTFKKHIAEIFTLPNKTPTLLIGSPFHDYIRVLCFAISTMVTLGFGGINIKIISGHNWLSTSAFVFVTLNLISGYLFLSVLVTRFGVLFQSQAPEQISKKQKDTILYLIILILFTFGIDVIMFNYSGIYNYTIKFIIELIIAILNPWAIDSFIYLLLLFIKSTFLFFKDK